MLRFILFIGFLSYRCIIQLPKGLPSELLIANCLQSELSLAYYRKTLWQELIPSVYNWALLSLLLVWF
jgi:hypothetical protein